MELLLVGGFVFSFMQYLYMMQLAVELKNAVKSTMYKILYAK